MWQWLKNLVRTIAPAPASKPAPRLDQRSRPGDVPPTPTTPVGQVEHWMPIRWSLYYALTDAEWNDLRRRQKERHPGQAACACPKGCPTNTLDELWDYDEDLATKRFRGGQWLCPGCHWLKSPTWRLETWERQRLGLLRPPKSPPHIIQCLGWTQEQVDALREKDLRSAERQQAKLRHFQVQHEQGQLFVINIPWQRLAPEQRRQLRQSGKTILAPWDIDLSALATLGYSPGEIELFTRKMLKLGETRLRGANR